MIFRKFLVIIVLGIVMPILLIIGLMAYPLDRKRTFLFFLARFWLKLLLKAAGVKVEFLGKEKLPKPPAIIVSNHLSHMDVPAIMTSIKAPFSFLTKKSLYKIPLFGLGLKLLGMIPVDRDNPLKRKQALTKAQEIAKSSFKPYIFFFPEGVRSPNGNLGPFKKGAFVMAKRTHLPLVIMKISGSNEVLPPKTLNLKKGNIKVEVIETLYSDVFSKWSVEELSNKVRTLLEQKKGEL